MWAAPRASMQGSAYVSTKGPLSARILNRSARMRGLRANHEATVPIVGWMARAFEGEGHGLGTSDNSQANGWQMA